jgi:hypothetical protein
MGAAAKSRATGAPCDERALELDAGRTGPRLRLAQDLVDERARGGCAEPHCAATVDSHVAILEQRDPRSSAGPRLRAGWLAATGKVVEAEAMLRERCEDVTDRDVCLQSRATFASRLPEAATFAAAADAFRRAVCLDAERCAWVNTWVGDAHAARGELGAAVAAYDRAVRDRPTEERLLKLAETAARAGRDSQALQALDRLFKLRGAEDPALEERIEAMRRRLAEDVVNR